MGVGDRRGQDYGAGRRYECRLQEDAISLVVYRSAQNRAIHEEAGRQCSRCALCVIRLWRPKLGRGELYGNPLLCCLVARPTFRRS